MRTLVLILSAIFAVSCAAAYFFYKDFDYHVASGVIGVISGAVFLVSILNYKK